jgi:hypothetical protein
MQDAHGFKGSEIGFAPHFSQRVEYGGDLDDEQFEAIVATPGLTTRLLMKPYIPTDAVIEWQFSGGDVVTAAAAAAGAAPNTVLAQAMKAAPPDTDHHHRWDATHLRQPAMEVIEERLAGLPPLAKTKGLYQIHLERKGGLEAPVSDDEPSTTTAPKSRKKQAASATPAPPPPPTATITSFASLLTSTGSAPVRKTVKRKKAGP